MIHPYIVNLANNKDEDKYQFAINFLINEVKRTREIGVSKIVLHPGSHVGLGVDAGIENIDKHRDHLRHDQKLLQMDKAVDVIEKKEQQRPGHKEKPADVEHKEVLAERDHVVHDAVDHMAAVVVNQVFGQ